MITVRDDMKTSSLEVGLERDVELSEKEVEDMRRRAMKIFMVLANRKVRTGEGEAMRMGFTRREDGDTNWMCVSISAELAKAGFEAIITDDGETVIKKVKKG